MIAKFYNETLSKLETAINENWKLKPIALYNGWRLLYTLSLKHSAEPPLDRTRPTLLSNPNSLKTRKANLSISFFQ